MSEDDLESLCVRQARVDELTAERASLTVGSVNPECKAFDVLIRELEARQKQDGGLGVVVRAVQSLNCQVAADKNRASVVED